MSATGLGTLLCLLGAATLIIGVGCAKVIITNWIEIEAPGHATDVTRGGAAIVGTALLVVGILFFTGAFSGSATAKNGPATTPPAPPTATGQTATGQTATNTTTASAIASPATLYPPSPVTLAPLSCDVNNPSIDFDQPAFVRSYADDPNASLFYFTCGDASDPTHIEALDNASIGLMPDSNQPTPAACKQQAQANPIGNLSVADITAGVTALCIYTPKQHIVWAKVTYVGDPVYTPAVPGPPAPTIRFEATAWQNT